MVKIKNAGYLGGVVCNRAFPPANRRPNVLLMSVKRSG